ncbi:MAG: hypothetical protein AAF415_17825 [Pseudomonadota bacterium]
MKPLLTAACLAVAIAAPAQADESFLGLDLEGSFGEGGFDRNRYVPPVTHFAFNETPFITTELRPIYVYHDIPNDFLTDGGRIHAVAAQGRIAITDRLAFIATTDGWADLDFNAALESSEGPLDVAAGFKYAVISDPEGGNIATVGLRYTAPLGNVEVSGIDLNGVGNGFLNPFISGAKLFEDFAVQGTLGFQIALAEDNWSFFHANLHADYDTGFGLSPFVEANLIAPFDGGNQLPGATLTGADVFDLGASDPQTQFTLGGGARFRLSDHATFGAGVEANFANRDTSVFGYRVTTDLVLHF